MPSTGSDAIVTIICIVLVSLFVIYLIWFVFRPYIIAFAQKGMHVRINSELQSLDKQERKIISRISNPNYVKKRVIDEETGSYLDDDDGDERKEASESNLTRDGLMQKTTDIVLQSVFTVPDINKGVSLVASPPIAAETTKSGKTRVVNMSPKRIAKVLKARQEASQREKDAAAACRIPTKSERIITGTYNFKKHFIYHTTTMGWMITLNQYLKIDKDARKNIYLQKHLGPYLHKISKKNINKSDDLLPTWSDDDTVVSTASSKKLKKGYRYKAKAIMKWKNKLPSLPSDYNQIKSIEDVIIT